MKFKFQSLIALFITCANLNGQVKNKAIQNPFYQPGQFGTVTTIDTLTQYFDRATSYYCLTDTKGYIMGSGTITTETACHYDDHGNLKVTDVMVIFCKASVKGLSDTISARVYSSGADSFPDVELASGKINVADLTSAALNGDPVFIPVSDYSAQPGAFLVSIDYSAIDDTISVMINNVLSLNGGPDGKKEKRVKQMENSVWKSAYDIWNLGGRQFDADALIIPVVSIETENGIYKTPEFELSSPFPNPANNVLYIQYVCLEKNPLEITIYDQIGRQKKSGILPYSLNGSVEIKTDEWSAGKYYYLIRGMKFQTVGKFEIVE